MLNETIVIRKLELKNRLVLPPMQTSLSDRGHVTEAMLQYYRDRAIGANLGLIITEHCCITEKGRAHEAQLSIAEDGMIGEHRRLTDAVHECGSRIFIQMNHAGSAAEPFDGGETVSASDLVNPRKELRSRPRALTVSEIKEIEDAFAAAAVRAVAAGYDGVEIHCAHGYLLDQFYSPLTNRRDDEYGSQNVVNRTRILRETAEKVRKAVGTEIPIAVRLGGSDYMQGGATEEDAVEACRLLSALDIDLLDISGGMCGYNRPEHREPGYFGSMTEKIKAAASIPVILTGGVRTAEAAETLLQEGKADLIGVGRTLYKNPIFAH